MTVGHYRWGRPRTEEEDQDEDIDGDKRKNRPKEGDRGLEGDWPSYTAQYDTHFSSLHTYSRDQGTGIF